VELSVPVVLIFINIHIQIQIIILLVLEYKPAAPKERSLLHVVAIANCSLSEYLRSKVAVWEKGKRQRDTELNRQKLISN
jgi:hypothetical protein